MTSKVDLDQFLEKVGARWPYDDHNYPGFAELDDRQRKVFIVKHSVLHMNKSLAKIATEVECADHGAPLDAQQVRIAIAKLLVNVLKLASELRMTAEQLEDIASAILRRG